MFLYFKIYIWLFNFLQGKEHFPLDIGALQFLNSSAPVEAKMAMLDILEEDYDKTSSIAMIDKQLEKATIKHKNNIIGLAGKNIHYAFYYMYVNRM
jgi:hypothetical protein